MEETVVAEHFIGLYLEFLFKTLTLILIAQQQLMCFPGDDNHIHEFSLSLNFN